ncbi:MAG: hypothetical protein IJY65_04980 [Clostridia bacterium]|nr:hypothetical protein [Clostridia bacterium]
MYAKYLNQYEIQYYRGNVLRHEGMCYSNPKAEVIALAGYKPVVDDEKPELEENQILVISYVDEPDLIRRVYTVESAV